VTVRTADGQTKEMTLGEAAARIELLESMAARAGRARATSPEPVDEMGRASGDVVPLPDDPWRIPIPTRPDGKPYTFEELRDLALHSTDDKLRAAAIRALRRDDTDAARTALHEILEDGKTPLELRVEAAKALARPPHRDSSSEELLVLLGQTDLPPDVRREVAEGVIRMRERGAFMPEISAQMTKETDPEVRKLLLDAVQRSAWDPAAKAELLALASDASKSLDERRLAVLALERQIGDPAVRAMLEPMLTAQDPALRESATRALGRAGKLGLSDLSAALNDPSAEVRAAAFAARLPTGKNVPKDQRQALIDTAARLIAGDGDPEVRRSALAWVSSMDRQTRDTVLAGARNDPDPLVRLDAYSRSPVSVAKQDSERILSELTSSDARVRDAAYRLVVRTWKIDVPYRAAWNPKARASAVTAIRNAVATH